VSESVVWLLFYNDWSTSLLSRVKVNCVCGDVPVPASLSIIFNSSSSLDIVWAYFVVPMLCFLILYKASKASVSLFLFALPSVRVVLNISLGALSSFFRFPYSYRPYRLLGYRLLISGVSLIALPLSWKVFNSFSLGLMLSWFIYLPLIASLAIALVSCCLYIPFASISS